MKTYAQKSAAHKKFSNAFDSALVRLGQHLVPQPEVRPVPVTTKKS